jgi:hypothetical protein
MVEGMSRTIKASIIDNSLSCLTPHGISPPISHIHFVDDILLMGLSTAIESLCFRSIIDLFCEASGMEVNMTKSQVFFFNMLIEIQNHLTQILGFTHITLPSVYLGIPLIDNPLRNSSWDSLLYSFARNSPYGPFDPSIFLVASSSNRYFMPSLCTIFQPWQPQISYSTP